MRMELCYKHVIVTNISIKAAHYKLLHFLMQLKFAMRMHICSRLDLTTSWS